MVGNTKMKKLLIIIVNLSENAPQSIRFRNLIKYLSEYYMITILTKDEFINTNDFNAPIEIIKIPYSSIGKLIISRTNPKEAKKSLEKKQNLSSYLLSKLKYTGINIWRNTGFRKIIFPDKYTFELNSFKIALKKLLKKKNLTMY